MTKPKIQFSTINVSLNLAAIDELTITRSQNFEAYLKSFSQPSCLKTFYMQPRTNNKFYSFPNTPFALITNIKNLSN